MQQLAEKIGADIAFEDEAGVGIMNRSGHTWGAVGQAPKVAITGRRGGYNVLSTITANGKLHYALEEKSIDGKRYIEFLENLLRDRTRPLIVIADNVSFHKALEVREFVLGNRKKNPDVLFANLRAST
ncbi:MAG TPA: transposase [Candidatus Competibacter sp.]|nr:transposase [Candidatus Competibacteraceae bacterium]HRW64773.1 transposase [Candidatus Competibacter sp.]